MRSRLPIILGAVIVVVLAFANPAAAASPLGAPSAGHQVSGASRPGSDAKQVLADCPRVSDSYDIGPGDVGGNVKEVQCLLNRTLSWQAFPFVIEVDSHYGTITTGAVREFQECVNARNTHIDVDGRVGPQTLPHLRWWGNIHTPSTGEPIC
jgi:hypothetical protein